MSSELEQFIGNDPEGLDRRKPDEAVLARVLSQVEAGRHNGKETGRVVVMPWVKWAVACLLIATLGITTWYLNKPQAVKDIVQTPAPKGAPLLPPPLAEDTGARQQVVQQPKYNANNTIAVSHKRKPMRSGPQPPVWLAGLHNMESAASRISAIFMAAKSAGNGNGVIDTLMRVLNDDPSASVRLAAIDGLAYYQHEDHVRRRLVASLPRQQDRFVQVGLIDALTRMKEASIVPTLESMVSNENTAPVVKDMAWAGIMRLRDRNFK